MFHWSDYSSDSATRDTPLLLSERSIQLALAAVASIQPFFRWDAADDSEWNDIDHAVTQLLFELMDTAMPDFTPVGVISAFMGEPSDVPAKWLLCDGDLFDSDDYPDLYAVIATRYHDGFGNFRVPNMEDRFLFGVGINDDLGDLAGENQHTLTTAELPAHHHIVPAHSHTTGTRPAAGSNAGSVSLGSLAASGTIATSTQAATDTSDTGGATAHNNMPAYIAVHWIIKALP